MADELVRSQSRNGIPTQVLVITGKKANRAYRQALWTPPILRHEETDLSQKGRNDEKAGTQYDESEKAGHHDPVYEHVDWDSTGK